MKPVERRVARGGNLLQDVFIDVNIIASIKGSTKKLGKEYKNALVVLYSKRNLSPLAVRKLDEHGNYQFLGLDTSLKCFIVGLDSNHQFNAVIQDNVVPK